MSGRITTPERSSAARGDVVIRPLRGERGEMDSLQQLFDSSPTYFERVTGGPAGPADAQSTYSALPDGRSYDDKFVFGVFIGNAMVGCIDVIGSYPDDRTAHIGLLLIGEPYQRKGFGAAALARLEDFVREQGSISTLRAGVVGTNSDVVPFWLAQGFRPTGETKPYRYANVSSFGRSSPRSSREPRSDCRAGNR